MMEVEEVGKEAILYTNVCPYNVIIHRLQCKNNDCTLQFLDLQGTDIKIYNVNNDILYTHTLLNAYTSAMSSSCKSMESWRTDMNRLFSFFLFACFFFVSQAHTKKCNMETHTHQIENKNVTYKNTLFFCFTNRYGEFATDKKLPPQRIFRAVWNSFWKKQLWDFDLKCPMCARPGYPYEVDEVVCDGVCVGVQRDKCPNLCTPKDIFPNDTVTVNMGKFERTRYTHNEHFQKQLIRLVVTEYGFFKRDQKVRKMKDYETIKFIKELRQHDRYDNFLFMFSWANNGDNFRHLKGSLVF